jgi:hypothetical protein
MPSAATQPNRDAFQFAIDNNDMTKQMTDLTAMHYMTVMQATAAAIKSKPLQLFSKLF